MYSLTCGSLPDAMRHGMLLLICCLPHILLTMPLDVLLDVLLDVPLTVRLTARRPFLA
jgi:hypothetical protein